VTHQAKPKQANYPGKGDSALKDRRPSPCTLRFGRLPFLFALLLIAAISARAVILYGTGDPTANTSAPGGALANSGWQYQGKFGGFLGTVIASNYFITAKHIGGSIGQTFTFNGINYTTTAVFPDPSTDLQVWRISGTFPSYAPLYSGQPGTEVGLNLVVFGRGTQRGNEVKVGSDSHLGGWLWGTGDQVERWGTNVVGSIQTDPTYGQLVRAPFDSTAGPNESHLSAGDSGGAVFVSNPTTNQWELAGINLAVDGPFSYSASGTNPFNAAMFDTTGLFVQDEQGGWTVAPNPSAFYATEIAARKAFINSVVMRLMSAVSSKRHGTAGTFDINLPQTVKPGIECRSGGPMNNYTIVFTFVHQVSVGGAAVTSGTGTETDFSVVNNQITVHLTGVTNAQTIELTLANVSDGTNSRDVSVQMDVLLADVDGTGRVDGNDVSEVQSHTRQTANNTNFRYDVDASGRIDGNDVSTTQSMTRSALRPPHRTPPAAKAIRPLPLR